MSDPREFPRSTLLGSEFPNLVTWEELRELPTISSSQGDDLKIDSDHGVRVWVSRCSVADGEPYERKVTVEVIRNGRWQEHRSFQARR